VASIFRLIDLACVPEPQDIKRWSALGVARDRLHVTGSIKFDPDLQRETEAASRRNTSPVSMADHFILFGGSTHRGEEEILAEIFLRLRQQFPSLRLFIAPRHVERLPEIRAQLDGLGLHVVLASDATNTHRLTDADCVLLDTTGELQFWYGIATVVFIGKSLTAHGGQNPVEPILAGKPVVFGPNMENFRTLASVLVAKQGAIEVSDVDGLERAIGELLRDDQTRQRLVYNARGVLSTHEGATARAAALVHKLNSEHVRACPP
jgi:3-deoxy-D-manno-octulosonic-acid transferase